MVIFPCAVQYILIAYLFYSSINSSLCLSLPCPYLAPPLSPLVTTGLLSVSESVSVLLYTFIYFLDSTVSDNIQCLSFSVSLISLSMIPSRSIYVAANGKISFDNKY